MARKSRGQSGFSQKQKSWIIAIIATGVVVGLLYWEQIALLYVLATLSVTVLLTVVALADLSGAKSGARIVTAGADALPVDGTVSEVKPISQSTFGARQRKGRN